MSVLLLQRGTFLPVVVVLAGAALVGLVGFALSARAARRRARAVESAEPLVVEMPPTSKEPGPEATEPDPAVGAVEGEATSSEAIGSEATESDAELGAAEFQRSKDADAGGAVSGGR